MTNNPLSEKENELALMARAVWGDNAVEFLVGALASMVTESQLDALIAKLRTKAITKAIFEPIIQEW